MQQNEFNQKFREKYENIRQAFKGYFNQDTESFKKGLDELLDNEKDALKGLQNSIQNFLNDKEFNFQQKKSLVLENIALDFASYNLDPLDWLKDLAHQIEEHLKNK